MAGNVVVAMAVHDLVKLVRQCRHYVSHSNAVNLVPIKLQSRGRNLGGKPCVPPLNSFGLVHDAPSTPRRGGRPRPQPSPLSEMGQGRLIRNRPSAESTPHANAN